MRELLDALDELTRRYYANDIEVDEYVAEVNMVTDLLRRYQ